jgi:hypothetical protein
MGDPLSETNPIKGDTVSRSIKLFFWPLLGLILLLSGAKAEIAPLSAPFSHTPGLNLDFDRVKNLGSKSDMAWALDFHTPVRDQGGRGTCSIFSAMGVLESLLIRQGLATTDLNLSEQYLNFTVQAHRNSDEEGSWSMYNWHMMKRYGVVTEETLPYNRWALSSATSGLGQERCGHLPEGHRQKVCLVAQFDPAYLNATGPVDNEEFNQARIEARDLHGLFIAPLLVPTNAPFSPQYRVNAISTVRSYLNNAIPVALELDVYYGAWNHPAADTYGIGRDTDQWAQGIVTFAERGSVDLEESMKNRAGHAVIIVGYDDSRVVQKTMKMTDGSTRTFTYRGVYYFKNSWGKNSFGRDFEVDGVSAPGYGMITYQYAHSKGSFFALPFRR